MSDSTASKILKEHEQVLKTTHQLKELFKKKDGSDKYFKMGVHLETLSKDLPAHFKYEEELIAYLFKCYLEIIGEKAAETVEAVDQSDDKANQPEEADAPKDELSEFFADNVLAILQIIKEHGRLLNSIEYLMKLFATKVPDETKMYDIKQSLTKTLVELLENHAAMEFNVFTPLIERNKDIEGRMMAFSVDK